MKKTVWIRTLFLVVLLGLGSVRAAELGPTQFFNMKEILDESTLDTAISEDKVLPSKVRPGKKFRLIALKFTSQNWHGMVWRHPARIYVPDGYQVGGNAGIYGFNRLFFDDAAAVQHTMPGTSLNTEEQFAEATAIDLGLPIMIFSDPPEDFQGMNEDDLMGFALKKVVTTGDFTWDGYSAILTGYLRAITLLHSLPGLKTERVVITGCSKRGVAVARATGVDPVRVAGVMSACYHGGNQLYAVARQFAEFGAEVRGPAKDRLGPGYQPAANVLRTFNSPAGLSYLSHFDPYMWRDKIKPSYLVTLGTNDEFFALGASNSMLTEMSGDKAFLAIDNTPHMSISPKHLAAWRMWLAHTFQNRVIPRIEAKGVADAERLRVSAKVDAQTQLVGVKLFYSYNPIAKDWRQATWESLPMDSRDGSYAASLPLKPGQKLGYYVEVEDSGVGGTGYVSSLVQTVE